MKRLPSVQQITEKRTKIIRKSRKINQISLKIEVWRGPRSSWEGSWGHSGPQGCSRHEKYLKSEFVYPPFHRPIWRPKLILCRFVDVILRFIFRQALGKASGPNFHWFLIVFLGIFWMFLLTCLVVHRTSRNVILIHYLLCLRHIAIMENMAKMW